MTKALSFHKDPKNLAFENNREIKPAENKLPKRNANNTLSNTHSLIGLNHCGSTL
ncbi:hypothetical protein MTR_1g093613 [Medicago truncatula]|uniref:Uncharacterized protein n=1 Tax=Medicago truncatula TaxID=3880 RepID=A0A072VNT2_MEDTR|nr:hypothetical protein MTR_1g093613 [Medicago truncatula]